MDRFQVEPTPILEPPTSTKNSDKDQELEHFI